MATSYYTDEMRAFVASLPNEYNFPVEISILTDDFGDFLVLSFNEWDYLHYKAEKQFVEIGNYLVELRNGLKALGARVTFAVIGGTDEEE